MKPFINTPLPIGATLLALAMLALTMGVAAFQLELEAVAAPPLGLKTQSGAPVRFNQDEQLERPEGYRRWPHVGTPLTPNDMNGGQAPFPEFHSVYINPAALDHYEATGAFPDGTVMIKELVSVGAKRASSGHGYFMGEFIGLEASVKDKVRFPDEPGNWAYFSFGHELPLKPTARPQPTANCNVCHGGAADHDFVFTQYYPVLGEVKDSATKK